MAWRSAARTDVNTSRRLPSGNNSAAFVNRTNAQLAVVYRVVAAPAVRARIAATVDEVDWGSAKVNMVCEARGLWVQPRMYGVSIEARDIIVYPEDDSCPTDDSD